MHEAGVCTGENFCCWVDGKVCEFSRDDGPDAERRFVCTLREELGDWTSVRHDKRYQEGPGAHWEYLRMQGRKSEHCDVFPRENRCGSCGFTPVGVARGDG